ncbi:MAG: hypothetical protein HQK78_00350 [Desulfobacterales bacterium]|nr:hypothetical protein [Desulfobacterales bacterium]
MPAIKLEEADRYFRQKAISPEEFDELYINADAGRGDRVFDRLKLLLSNNIEGSLKILLAGHRGCGKTTELIRLQKYIDNDFIILNFSVAKELDMLNIHYIELFIVAMEKLFLFVQKNNFKIADEYLENIKNWVTSHEIETVRTRHLGADIETEMKAGINVPFLAKFFGRFKASAKASSSMKETLKTTIEPKLNDLIWHCNRLITEIKNQLSDINKKGLVIIIEDLDKIPMDKAEDIFYSHSAQVTQLNCHCIFTFPISLLYNIRFRSILSSYDDRYVLPMIRISERKGGECREGIKVIKNIVKQRITLSLFEDTKILEDMIKNSGGCLWDLFRMIRDASSNAVVWSRQTISKSDYMHAYHSLKGDYERTIGDNKEKSITVDKYYECLKECAEDLEKKPKYSAEIYDLMSNLTILNYNGENWSDVHPIVRDILKERKLIA